jgi:hypothetical protein
MLTPYFFILGSRTSLRASPRVLKARIIRAIVTAGKTSLIGYVYMPLSASLTIEPSDALGAEIPNPIKLRKDSTKIALGICKVAVTMIGPIELSSKCLRIILP